MKKISGQSPWEKDLKKQQYKALNEDIDCEVLIIGGGITGALSAYYSIKNNLDVVVLEKDVIASESTLGSTSIVHYEIDTDLIRLRALVGEKEANSAFMQCFEAVDELEKIINELDDDCEFIHRPSFYYGIDENTEYMFDEYLARKDLGFNVEFLKKDNPRYGFDYSSGVLSHDGGAELNPVKLTNALFKHVDSKARIYESTNVKELDLDKVEVTTSDGFKVKCKKIIMATGYDMTEYFEKPFWNITRTFQVLSKPVNNFHGWYQRSFIKENSNKYTYLRTTIDNRIIIGGEDIDVTEFDKDKFEMSNNHPLALKSYEILKNKLTNMFPHIDIEFESTFNGIFIDSVDGLPFFGEHPEYPNIYFNMSIGSNGILYALLGGKYFIDYFNDYNNKENIFLFGRLY